MTLYKVVFANDLSVNESVVLALMWHKKDSVIISRKIIAKSFNLTERTITNIFASLKEKGYIARKVVAKNNNICLYDTFFLKKTYDLYIDKKALKRKQENGKALDDLSKYLKGIFKK